MAKCSYCDKLTVNCLCQDDRSRSRERREREAREPNGSCSTPVAATSACVQCRETLATDASFCPKCGCATSGKSSKTENTAASKAAGSPPMPATSFHDLEKFMVGMEERLGGKTDELRRDIQGQVIVINTRMDAQDTRIGTQDGKLDACEHEVKESQKQFKSLQSSLGTHQSMSSRPDAEKLAKQAWLGGFQMMEKEALEKEATKLLGESVGFEKVQCRSAVGTGVVVSFASNHDMKEFVSKAKLPGKVYAKPNRPPKSEIEKATSSKVTEAWDCLVKAGITKQALRANPRKGIVWIINKDGVAAVAATIENEAIKWGPAAPKGISL